MNASPGKWEHFRTLAIRSLRARCPRCGGAPLFKRYLKQVDECRACGEPWGVIRADDGPAWLTIMIVGHIMAPLVLLAVMESGWPDWLLATALPLLALVLCILVLPWAKWLFIAAVWRTRSR